ATLAPLRIWVENRLLKVKDSSAAGDRIPLGRVHLKRGYVRTWWSDSLSALEVQPFTPEVVFNYVRDNQDNRYYWGRRGPSVHLNYLLPKESNAEYFYQEVTVPNGMDPIGSYFMAAGFGEGYFGIQVNGPDERRILFSVWSPYKTDDPGAIPENEKIRLIAKGEGVYVGEFGHEGSGGQSYLRYPWKAGQKYCFLLRGKPDGKGSTLFSAWFKPFGAAEWRLVATFSRPQTDHCLTRLHAFLENFEDHQGYLTRKALYSHACYREISGKWFPLTSVRFTGDDIARRGYRLDFDGGVEGDGFYLQNGGFFNPTGKAHPYFSYWMVRNPWAIRQPIFRKGDCMHKKREKYSPPFSV
ncbi:MAG: DUF3472 domain-containing protein, partial [Marinilabiliales bacterium]|nr:DUF3472 domain-containing protein [Marinilabiliales bacterium]